MYDFLKGQNKQIWGFKPNNICLKCTSVDYLCWRPPMHTRIQICSQLWRILRSRSSHTPLPLTDPAMGKEFNAHPSLIVPLSSPSQLQSSASNLSLGSHERDKHVKRKAIGSKQCNIEKERGALLLRLGKPNKISCPNNKKELKRALFPFHVLTLTNGWISLSF